MKNFVSFNIQTYKKSDAKGLILHSHSPKARKKSTNIKFPEYSKYNIQSDGDVWSKYNQITNEIESEKGKKIQKNANHFLEGVLAFSFDKFKDDPKKFRAEAPALIEKYMNELCEKYGFTPLGWSLHFDEGHKDSDSKDLNVHAHIQMVNYDFKTHKARFREYQQKYVKKRKVPNQHFVAMQDLAGEVFKPLEFVRGVSKQKTQKVHLDKEDYVTQKLQDREKQLDAVESDIKEKQQELQKIEKETTLANLELLRVQEDIQQAETRLSALNRSISTLIARFSKKLRGFVENVQKGRFDAFYDDVESVQNVIDDTAKHDHKVSDDMTDTSNEIASSLKADKPFKKKNRPT